MKTYIDSNISRLFTFLSLSAIAVSFAIVISTALAIDIIDWW